MKVRFTRRASLRAERADKWWRQNRPTSPDLFSRELAEAVQHLETVTSAGTPHPTPRRPGLKRLLLGKTGCHLYFEVDESKHQVRVLILWGAPRGSEPKL